MRKCHFCGKPILSDTAYKIYHLVNDKAIDRKYKPLSCLDVTNKIDRERMLKEIPLPEKYRNPNTTIKILQSCDNYSFKIFAANPKFCPLLLDVETKEWKELICGIPDEWR